MATLPLPDETLRKSVEAFQRCGTIAAASRELGISWDTLRNRLMRAEERNLTGEVSGKPLPIGERITGRSTLYDEQNNRVLEWVKTARDKVTEDAVDAIRAAFDSYKGLVPRTPAPKATSADLLTLYNIADHHLGLYSWADETGADYDLAIGADILRGSMTQLVDMAPPAETAVILNLGDFFHSDTNENRTLRSGHALDVDTRYAKVLQTGVDLLMECVQMALAKHKRVIVRCLPGNHDDHSALALSVALAAAFKKEPRIDVDTNPGRFWFHRHGKVMLAATHGDKTKLADMPGIMAATRPDDWGATLYRHSFSGHIHHQSRVEKHGAICETMPTLAAKDAYAASHGYSSNRSMIAISYHAEKGEFARSTVNVSL